MSTILRLGLAAVLCVAAIGVAAGCGDSSSSGSTSSGSDNTSGQTAAGGGELQPGDGKITVVTWEGYHEDDWIAEAEKNLGLSIDVTRIGSVDEMYTLARTGSADADLFLLDSGSIPRYIDAGLIAPIDKGAIEGLDVINPGLNYEETNTIDGDLWGVPYNWGTQPLVFDSTKVPEAARNTWETLWDPTYAGAVMIPDDSYITLPMVAIAAGVPPFEWTDEDYAKVEAKLDELRPQLRTLTRSVNEQGALMVGGEAEVGYAQLYGYIDEDPNLEISFPEEGTPMWLDNYVVAADSGSDADVYEFINYTLKPEWQCRLANVTFQNGILNRKIAEGCFDKEVWDGAGGNLVSRLTSELSERLVPLQAPEDFDKRLALWNSFKAGT